MINISENEGSFSFTPSPLEANMNGVTHGGILAYFCDEVLGRYVTSLGRKGAAVGVEIHFYRPAPIGDRITATVSERKAGKRLGTYLVELKNSNNQLLADALFTISFLE